MTRVEAKLKLSVVLCTYNPNLEVLRGVLDNLRAQSLDQRLWELLLVDNCSKPAVAVDLSGLPARLLKEPTPGLTSARRCGVRESFGSLIVFVDDDNFLASTYLEDAIEISERLAQLGAFGGKVLPRWEDESKVPDWIDSVRQNLALRDFGELEVVEGRSPTYLYPKVSPVGAGMIIRRSAIEPWCRAVDGGRSVSDRCGASLASAGDNDIVLFALLAGFDVGYFPQLQMEHFIPNGRLDLAYNKRLAYSIMRSWVGVLALHGVEPWKACHPWLGALRKFRIYLINAPWNSPAAQLKYSKARGLIDSRIDLYRARVNTIF
jgi:glycosyltransferase involved in cell wall biosynthesis